MSAYTDQAQIEKVIQRSLTADEAEILDIIIEAVSAAINEYTGRLWFDIDTDAEDYESSVKLYDGNGQRELFIDDFTTLDSVAIVDLTGTVVQTLDDTYYKAYPLNKPWKNSIYWSAGIFSRGHANVQVTALFYTGALPAEVQLVAATLAGAAFTQAKDSGDFKKESIEGYSYERMTSADITQKEKLVISSLDKWRKIYV